MNQDISKFEELMRTDPAFQEKLNMAAKNYTGDPADEKAFFETVLLPLAKEVGLSATFEEFSAYMKEIKEVNLTDGKDLSADELAQVSGGKGTGLMACVGMGIGFGGGSKGGCVGTGAGWGGMACTSDGSEVEPFDGPVPYVS